MWPAMVQIQVVRTSEILHISSLIRKGVNNTLDRGVVYQIQLLAIKVKQPLAQHSEILM